MTDIKSPTMSVLRTPDACFDNLPLWDYEPLYFTSTLYGLAVRIAYYDLGEKDAEETILLTPGLSTWSYLYRRMIPPFVSAGHRVILFDQVGCGRSDKPSREPDYTYERHIGWNIDLLINHLRLKSGTAGLGRSARTPRRRSIAAWAVFQKFTKPVLLAFSDEDTVMAGGEAIWLEHCPGTKRPGVTHVTINGVGHFRKTVERRNWSKPSRPLSMLHRPHPSNHCGRALRAARPQSLPRLPQKLPPQSE